MSGYQSNPGAERRPINHRTSTRLTSTTNQDEAKQQSRSAGFGVNAAEKQSSRRDPFRNTGASGHIPGKSKDSAQVDYGRSGRAPGSDAVRAGSTWSPQVSLVSATTAPLASRISVPPLSSSAPKELQPAPLSNLSLNEQEYAVLEDLLFVLMGFEGQYIRFTDSYKPMEEKDRLTGPTFRIQPGLDPSLRDLTTSILKLASHYIALEAFVEVQSREEFGTVNHALCAAIRKLLKDYLTLVAQLEHQLLTNDGFTLHQLTLHTKPTGHVLFQLYSLAHEILRRNSILEDNDDSDDAMDDVDGIIQNLRDEADVGGIAGKKVCKGGSVLGLITKRLASMFGDPAARELLTSLLRESSRPYMTMLNEWLHHGGIRDPHGEFLIKEQKSIKREKLEQDYTDEYWEKRYTVREGDVPPQLEGVKDKVLLAGKYLNVVRECGGVDISKEVRDAPKSFDDPRFLENVNSAYSSANSSLLNLLLTTHALPARLRSLKHYFFLDRSDFFSYFLELSHSELRKPAKMVNISKLQSLLDIVVRQPGTVAAEDPFKEDIKVAVDEVGLTNWLMKIVNVTGLDADAANPALRNLLVTPAAAPDDARSDKDLRGFDALVFDYAVPFPLSLVISRVTLTRYQLLFRYVLSLRHLENQLTLAWTESSKSRSWTRRSPNKQLELVKREAWTLRARMLCFVQQLLYFSTAEVIEPNWQALMARLNEGDLSPDFATSTDTAPRVKRTVDELMQDHVDFLATCLKECMLTNAQLLKTNASLMEACTKFAAYTARLSHYFADSDEKADEELANTEKVVENLHKFERFFSRKLQGLIGTLNHLAATETVAFLGLCARLSTASEGLPGASVMGYEG